MITAAGIRRDGDQEYRNLPNGFLQDPQPFLRSKGYQMLGWPDGLPDSPFQDWEADTACALAYIILKNRLRIEPTGRCTPAPRIPTNRMYFREGCASGGDVNLRVDDDKSSAQAGSDSDLYPLVEATRSHSDRLRPTDDRLVLPKQQPGCSNPDQTTVRLSNNLRF